MGESKSDLVTHQQNICLKYHHETAKFLVQFVLPPQQNNPNEYSSL